MGLSGAVGRSRFLVMTLRMGVPVRRARRYRAVTSRSGILYGLEGWRGKEADDRVARAGKFTYPSG